MNYSCPQSSSISGQASSGAHAVEVKACYSEEGVMDLHNLEEHSTDFAVVDKDSGPDRFEHIVNKVLDHNHAATLEMEN